MCRRHPCGVPAAGTGYGSRGGRAAAIHGRLRRPAVTEAVALGGVWATFTGRPEGDLGHAGTWVEVDEINPDVAARRHAVLDRPWSWVRQVHGNGVVVVDAPGAGVGQVGDALVASAPGPALAILTADCAPIA